VFDFEDGPQYWYFAAGLAWAAFQGIRGAVEARLAHPQAARWRPWQRFIVLDVQEFAFRFVCTLAGFVALYMALVLFNDADPAGEVPFVDSVVLLALFLIGVLGIGGQLHYALLLGRRPTLRSD
jgi:uncharacterized membrane protein (DUF4010 family)